MPVRYKTYYCAPLLKVGKQWKPCRLCNPLPITLDRRFIIVRGFHNIGPSVFQCRVFGWEGEGRKGREGKEGKGIRVGREEIGPPNV
jgi:hypothetical protein